HAAGQSTSLVLSPPRVSPTTSRGWRSGTFDEPPCGDAAIVALRVVQRECIAGGSYQGAANADRPAARHDILHFLARGSRHFTNAPPTIAKSCGLLCHPSGSQRDREIASVPSAKPTTNTPSPVPAMAEHGAGRVGRGCVGSRQLPPSETMNVSARSA